MESLIKNFPNQLREAWQIGNAATLQPAKSPFRNVLITGLGGSGIGGTIIAEITQSQVSVPVTVNKDYFVPKFVGPDTLVIASSYSGNTEETLQAVQQASDQGAHIVCITSGGTLQAFAKEKGYDAIVIPGGNPPRSCLGYSLTQLFIIFAKHKLIPESFLTDLQSVPDFLDQHLPAIQAEAKDLTEFLYGKIPVIYAAAGSEGVAVRFRQQVNENAKMLCWHHVLPEMNHNELVGWAGGNEQMAVVVFRNKTDYKRTQRRMEVGKEIITRMTPHYREVFSVGETPLTRAFHLIHLGDWVSLYLGQKKGVDVTEVKVIDHLKSALAAL
ncbi:MAG: bifunctional phosphoglucose/phosphomannose isomerase [Flavobacteriales bacterium]|nr:bifunctional phosphoglucose/phosphomannose isomerase [Flavobacteriales bacterium]